MWGGCPPSHQRRGLGREWEGSGDGISGESDENDNDVADAGGDGRYMVDKERDGPLVSMDVKDFILTVGARSPSPGGGSVAALTATLVCSFSPLLSIKM